MKAVGWVVWVGWVIVGWLIAVGHAAAHGFDRWGWLVVLLWVTLIGVALWLYLP